MNADGNGVMVVKLPAASPRAYLRWMAYWHELERSMLEHPSLETLAAVESAPYAREFVADFLSVEVTGQISRQAEAAERQGRGVVTPRLSGERHLLAEAVGFVIRQARWLEEAGVAEALGVRPLASELVPVRDRAILAVQLRLQAELAPAGR